MFESTIALFDQYYRNQGKKETPGFNSGLGVEVRERLQQLNYIVSRVQELELIATRTHYRCQAVLTAHIEDLERRGIPYKKASAPRFHITREEFEAERKASFEMKLLTEAFYYLAGRVRTILRNKQNPLPGLNNFECKGVRNVRNKLLEHAESKDSSISSQSFAWGASRGPVLKAVRRIDQKHIFPDNGLYVNAKEFRDNLEVLLRVVLAKS